MPFLVQKIKSKSQGKFKHFQSNCNLTSFLSVFLCLISFSNAQGQNNIYKLKTSINTQMEITNSLSISPSGSQLMIGSTHGEIKVFNTKTGSLDSFFNQQQQPIISTIWVKHRNGLVTLSANNQTNQSQMIVRDQNNFLQMSRITLNGTAISTDYSETEWETYVAVSLGRKVEEYELRELNRTNIFYGLGTRMYELSYSYGHKFFYALGYNETTKRYWVHHIPCGDNFFVSYWRDGKISSLEADKGYNQYFVSLLKEEGDQVERNTTTNQVNQNVIELKQIQKTSKMSQGTFRAQDFSLFNLNYTFPDDQEYEQFRYCPSDYIIGVGSDSMIVLFSRDYEFTIRARIDLLYNAKIKVKQVICRQGHLLISGQNNYVHVYELTPFSNDETPTNWTTVGLGITGGVLVLAIIGMVVYKKVYKVRKLQKQQQDKSLSLKLAQNQIVQTQHQTQ